MATEIPEFEAYVAYFSNMGTDELMAFLNSAVPQAGLSSQSHAFLKVFAQRILFERNAKEAAEQQQEQLHAQMQQAQQYAQHLEQVAAQFQSQLQDQAAAAQAAGQAAQGQQPDAASQPNPHMFTQGNYQPLNVQSQMQNTANLGGAAGLSAALQKTIKPPVFDGRNVADWIFKIRQYIDTVDANASDTDKINFVSNLFTGKALTWWRYIVTSGSGYITFKALLDDVQAHFIDTDHVNKLRDRLDALVQGKSTVQTYITKFKELQVELGRHALPGEQALYKFVKGLNTQVRVFTNMSRPRDFDDACLAAIATEQSLHGSMGTTNNNNNNRAQQRNVDRMDLGIFTTQSNQQRSNTSRPNNQNRSTTSTNARHAKGKQPASSNDAWKRDATCHHCGKKGHIKPDCRSLQNQRNGASTSKAPQRKGNANLAQQVAALTAQLAELQAQQKPSKN